jgi:aminopeptidase N
MIAGRDPDGGWMLDPTSLNGDPIFSDTAMYTVTITAPDDLQFITSGIEIDSVPAGDGLTARTWSAAPSRDFVMLADADMESVQQEVDGTTVTSWYHRGNAAPGEAALLWTVQSLELFNGLLGEYPYANLHVSEAAMFNAAGVEYPQMFTVGSNYYRHAPEPDVHGYFEFTVAHEVVHQWFYGIVGNNQYEDAFIDEGLTNYLSSLVYFSALYGEEIGEDVFERNIARPFRYMIESNSDVIISTDTDAFPTGGAYVDAVYVKAPMGFFTIHEEIGDEAFFGAIQSYVEEFRFRVATPGDLLAAFEAVTDSEISPIWTHWFDRREGGLDIRD